MFWPILGSHVTVFPSMAPVADITSPGNVIEIWNSKLSMNSCGTSVPVNSSPLMSKPPVTWNSSPSRTMLRSSPVAPPERVSFPANSESGTASNVICCPTKPSSSYGSAVEPSGRSDRSISANRSSTLWPLSSSRLSSTAITAVPDTVSSADTSRSMFTLKHPARSSAIAAHPSSRQILRVSIPVLPTRVTRSLPSRSDAVEDRSCDGGDGQPRSGLPEATYAGRRAREGGGFPGTLRLHTSEDGASAGGAETPLRHPYPSPAVLNVGCEKVPVKIP